jgi:DNA modification methylase
MIRPEIQHLAVDLSTLEPHPNNVRQGDIGAIAISLSEHGQYRPIVVQKHTNRILAGNHTYKAAKQLGWQQIAATFVEVSDEQALRILLMDNRANDLATYDDNALADLLKELAETELGLAGTGFDPDDLDQLISDLGKGDRPINGDPDDIPEPPPAKTVPGDLWLLGPHRLLCGSSTVPTDVDKLMQNDKATMMFTDPPWNVAIGKDRNPRHRQRKGLENDDLSPQDFTNFLNGFATNAARYVDGDIYCVLGSSTWPTLDTALRNAGYHWSATVIWVKDVFVLGRSKYHRRYEPIWYGWHTKGKSSFQGRRDLDDVWEVPRPRRSDEHPTMKPIELMKLAIEASSAPGDIVLDLFGGSGSTLIAAHTTGRTARLMELDPTYCDVICARYQALTGDQPVNALTNNPHDFLQQ